MREVAEARRAEHERQADRGECEQQAEVEAVEDALDDLVEEADRVALALTDEEVGDGDARLAHVDRAHVGLLEFFVDHRDAFGQRVFVESDGVLALLGNPDRPAAVFARDDLDAEALTVDDQLHVAERLVSELDEAADAVVVVVDADLFCRSR